MADIRLIDADAWIAKHCEGCSYISTGICNPSDPVCGAVKLMNVAPTIDAVPVVRCKECKFSEDVLDNGCFQCNRKMIGMVRPDDFCSFGERKDDGLH